MSRTRSLSKSAIPSRWGKSCIVLVQREQHSPKEGRLTMGKLQKKVKRSRQGEKKFFSLLFLSVNLEKIHKTSSSSSSVFLIKGSPTPVAFQVSLDTKVFFLACMAIKKRWHRSWPWPLIKLSSFPESNTVYSLSIRHNQSKSPKMKRNNISGIYL